MMGAILSSLAIILIWRVLIWAAPGTSSGLLMPRNYTGEVYAAVDWFGTKTASVSISRAEKATTEPQIIGGGRASVRTRANHQLTEKGNYHDRINCVWHKA